MHNKLHQELALVGSIRILQIIGPVLRPEEVLDAREEIAAVVQALLENYDDEIRPGRCINAVSNN